MAYKADDFFGFSTFDPSRMAQGFREAAEKGAEQSREAYSRMREVTTDATKTVEDTFQSAQSGSFELGMKVADTMRSSADLSIAHMEAMMGVRSVSELFELQSSFMRKQAELTAQHMRGMQETTRKVAEQVTKPGRAAAERAMAGFKAA
ncbi:phasin family protein [Neorhizobium sp. JUb45]|uniref:phasin family protein n=1 Tax=unclassified Neorhizobium TaxID=2629175 RepID=UPI00104B81AC|nr:phasin family protein [Neorhizobium sp. JUb45]TCR04032.1 phasin [Neorhizobium sp. JUb45]